MPALHFDRLHSVEVRDGRFHVVMFDADNKGYPFTVEPDAAALLCLQFLQAAKSLPVDRTDRSPTVLGFEIATYANAAPDLRVLLSDELFLDLSIPTESLDVLRAALEEIRRRSP